MSLEWSIWLMLFLLVAAMPALAFLAQVPLVRARTWTHCRFACCLSYDRMDFPCACTHSEVCTLSVGDGRRPCHCAKCERMDGRRRRQPSWTLPSQHLCPLLPTLKSSSLFASSVSTVAFARYRSPLWGFWSLSSSGFCWKCLEMVSAVAYLQILIYFKLYVVLRWGEKMEKRGISF